MAQMTSQIGLYMAYIKRHKLHHFTLELKKKFRRSSRPVHKRGDTSSRKFAAILSLYPYMIKRAKKVFMTEDSL